MIKADFELFAKSWRNGSIKGVFDTYNKSKVEKVPDDGGEK